MGFNSEDYADSEDYAAALECQFFFVTYRVLFKGHCVRSVPLCSTHLTGAFPLCWWCLIVLKQTLSPVRKISELCEMALIKFWVLKDRAHLSTFEFFILEKFSCIVVLIVFFVIVQSSGLISVWFRQNMTFFINFISFIYLCDICGRGLLGAAGRLQVNCS